MALPRYLAPREVAELLSCSYGAALRIMRAAGARKMGALVRVSEEDLESYINACHDPESLRVSSAAKTALDSLRISAVPSRTSHSTLKTNQKPSQNSRPCSSLADYEKLIRGTGR